MAIDLLRQYVVLCYFKGNDPYADGFGLEEMGSVYILCRCHLSKKL